MQQNSDCNDIDFLFQEIASLLYMTGKEIEYFWTRGQHHELHLVLSILLKEYDELHQELIYLDSDRAGQLPDVEDLMTLLTIPSPFQLTLNRYLGLVDKIDFDTPIGPSNRSLSDQPNFHHIDDEDDTPMEV